MKTPSQIVSPFDFSTFKPNDSIVIGSHDLSVEIDKKATIVTAEISLKFTPFPMLWAKFPLEALGIDPLMLMVHTVNSQIRITAVNNPESECVVSDWDSEHVLAHFLLHALSGPKNSSLTYVTFHVLNFPKYHGTPVSKDAGWHAGRLALDDGTWRVTMDADRSTSDLTGALSKMGGYALTHIGKLERASGRRFSSTNALSVVERLMFFLCFARSDWAPPLIVTGYDDSDTPVWYDWSLKRSTPWTNNQTWWPSTKPSILQGVFPTFMSLLDDKKIWGPSLRKMIYWYCHASSRNSGADGSLILLQSALEILAWTYLTRHRKAISEKTYGRMDAADSLRLLLNFCEIDDAIPSRLPLLVHFASQPSRLDGPAAFTSIRNWTIHPTASEVNARLQKTTKSPPHFQALQLGIEYFERVLLHLCNYRGPYMPPSDDPFRKTTVTIG